MPFRLLVEATRSRLLLSIGFVFDRTEMVELLQYDAGIVIAQRLNTVRKRYKKKRVQNRGVSQNMLSKYMKNLTRQDDPVVLSITESVSVQKTETVIHRNHTHEGDSHVETDIYLRARNIFLRARRHRPVRAASIF